MKLDSSYTGRCGSGPAACLADGRQLRVCAAGRSATGWPLDSAGRGHTWGQNRDGPSRPKCRGGPLGHLATSGLRPVRGEIRAGLPAFIRTLQHRARYSRLHGKCVSLHLASDCKLCGSRDGGPLQRRQHQARAQHPQGHLGGGAAQARHAERSDGHRRLAGSAGQSVGSAAGRLGGPLQHPHQ